ncbi:YbaB/EbfC family nucleoid-associated protein [Saccharothrix australiensis]|uniref:YbaB/EbfC DNA-binding family protein n=1 Tax=Saccharothrix australiensis TaxID=2072 RepID=A0A495W8M8_9PSEU|nr:YbaB/EbfC family nucleoid-associated protein [Saccharothrix australiensis]RKT57584.1 YbaB/EbfC DNA-binding family protein [Saccharothrix australiensis]
MSAREERIAAADRLTEVLSRVTGTATHHTGLVTVTATAVGALTSVRLHPSALAHGPDAVGGLVAETARLATDAAVQTSYNEVAKGLGDSVAMAIEDFAGPPPYRQGSVGGRPGTAPDQAGPAGHPGPAGRSTAPGRPFPPGGAAGRPFAPGRPTAPGQPFPPGAGQPFPPGGPAVRPPVTGGAPGHRPPPATARPWSAQPPQAPQRARPPVDDDDDDYFADPFRGQRR